jgi:PadR family transcriptional regulator, regulatory protein PadR
MSHQPPILPDADQTLYSGLIRLHLLHHACRGPIFGLGMIAELARHGYRLSPGTLYPLLHGLEARGLFRSARVRSAGRTRRVYRATAAGRAVLAVAKLRVKELFGELLQHDEAGAGPRQAGRARGELPS